MVGGDRKVQVVYDLHCSGCERCDSVTKAVEGAAEGNSSLVKVKVVCGNPKDQRNSVRIKKADSSVLSCLPRVRCMWNR